MEHLAKARDWLNQNSAIVIIAAAALVVLSVVISLLRSCSPATRQASSPDEVYFYDLNTGKRFVGSARDVPPIDAPSGPYKDNEDLNAGVRAYVFSCDGCQTLRTGYLEVFPPDAHEQLTELMQNSNPSEEQRAAIRRWRNEARIATPADLAWVPARTSRGRALRHDAPGACEDGRVPIPCYP